MLYKLYTNKTKPENLVLFFAGFASHPDDFSHLKTSSKFDIAIIYDYTNIAIDNAMQSLLKSYKKLEVYGFSMGVAVASRLNLNANFMSAICGTSLGIDKVKGIHPAIFKQSIKNFDTDAFAANIGIKKLHHKPTSQHKQELQSIFDFCTSTPPQKTSWQNFIAASKDTIFSPQSIQAESSKSIKIIEQKHFIFYEFSSWDEICKM